MNKSDRKGWMIGAVETIGRVAAAIHEPKLKAAGLTIINPGNDFGEVVTDVDLSASKAFVHGSEEIEVESLGGFHEFPVFSEEEDNSERLNPEARFIVQVDPMDGSGDAKKAGISPTILVSLLERKNGVLVPMAGIIYDVLGRYAITSDGIGVYLMNTRGGFEQMELIPPPDSRTMYLPHRQFYPQVHAHDLFPTFMRGEDVKVQQVKTGGAGRQWLHFFRSFIKPPESHPFYSVRPINVLANFQPDWKTWDVNPGSLILDALYSRGYALYMTNIFDEPLHQHAALPTLQDMVLKEGLLIAGNPTLQVTILEMIQQYSKQARDPRILLTKEY